MSLNSSTLAAVLLRASKSFCNEVSCSAVLPNPIALSSRKAVSCPICSLMVNGDTVPLFLAAKALSGVLTLILSSGLTFTSTLYNGVIFC